MKRRGHPLLSGEKKDPKKTVLIYDGECSVCRVAVGWIRARSSPGTFEFLSFHSGEMEKRFPFLDREACKQAAHLVLTDGRVLAGDQAALEVFSRIPGYRWVANLMTLPGAGTLSGVLYRWFARRRHAIASLFHPGHNKT